jgi:hypothetical protein
MTIQNRTVIVQKDKTLSKITIPKLSIMWFFEWLKLALDYNGKTIEFKKSKKFTGGARYGATKETIKHKIVVNAWKQFDLREIKSMKPILSMTDKEKFNYLNKMFLKYKHLFGDFTLRYIKDSKDLIDDKNYFTVQIPISKNRIDIDNELEKLRTIHNIQKSEKKTNISFHRPVKHKEMKRMFDVFKLKEQTKLKNEEIALKVKYKTGTYTKQGKTYQKKDVYIIKGTQQVQQGGVRQVQNAYASAKKLIINIAKGDFPKNKL